MPRKIRPYEKTTEQVFRKLFPKPVRERATLEVEKTKKPAEKRPTEKDSS